MDDEQIIHFCKEISTYFFVIVQKNLLKSKVCIKKIELKFNTGPHVEKIYFFSFAHFSVFIQDV